MKTIKMFTYAVLVLFIGFSISCEGPEGPAGPAGTNGTNGNANVKTIMIAAASTTWTADSYLGSTANSFTYTSNLVTQSVLDHGAVLGYLKLGSVWHSLPYSFDYNISSYWEHITFTHSLNQIKIYAYRNSGAMSASHDYKFLLITDNTVTTGRLDANSNVYTQLTEAGVDINNYYDVCAYYGIDPE